MSRIHYRGPFDRVAIPLPDGRDIEVAKGKDVDLADHLPRAEAQALARSLLEQESNWSSAEPDKSAKGAEKED